jgi:hypothetical protein
MMGRDLESDLDMLTGHWGMHEADWFRENGIEVAIYGIEKALEYKANNKRLLNMLKRVYMVSKICGEYGDYNWDNLMSEVFSLIKDVTREEVSRE